MSKSISTKKSDLKAINAIVRRFFAAFISSDLAKTNLSQLKKDFLKDAVIVSASPTKQTVEKLPSFLKPRQKILTDGRLRHFRERELSHVTTIVGDIAERRSKYIKKGYFNGAKYGGQGIKFFHFIKTSRGWKISALIWTDEK